jgi:hypothetical protein
MRILTVISDNGIGNLRVHVPRQHVSHMQSYTHPWRGNKIIDGTLYRDFCVVHNTREPDEYLCTYTPNTPIEG